MIFNYCFYHCIYIVAEDVAHGIQFALHVRYSYQLAFKKLLSEVDDYAGQHERISETLQDTVFKEMHQLSAESKVERKKVALDGFITSSSFHFLVT